MRTVSIDPGLKECGVAVWEDGVLVAAYLVQTPLDDTTEDIDLRILAMGDALESALPSGVDRLVIERMEPRKDKQAAWSNLLDLAYISGRASGQASEVRFLRPSVWTGKRNKMQNHPRIRARLSAAELEALAEGLRACPKGNHKELLDAVGIGLYDLERL